MPVLVPPAGADLPHTPEVEIWADVVERAVSLYGSLAPTYIWSVLTEIPGIGDVCDRLSPTTQEFCLKLLTSEAPPPQPLQDADRIRIILLVPDPHTAWECLQDLTSLEGWDQVRKKAAFKFLRPEDTQRIAAIKAIVDQSQEAMAA